MLNQYKVVAHLVVSINAGETFVAAIESFNTDGGFVAVISVLGNSIFGRYDGVVKCVSATFSGFKFTVAVVNEDKDTEHKLEGPSLITIR